VKYYNSDDETELAANMVLLMKNPELRQQQVANALKYVEAHNWDIEKYQYLGIVDSLVAMRPVLQSSPAPLEACAISNSKTNQG
jgi:glycosyltransferase involved in cell wall biosynthesis